jgi:Protein of unknown function (DUF1822)
MTTMTTEEIKILLDDNARAQALEAAAEQIDLDRGRLAYCNTLAVHAMHTYLGWMQIRSDLENISDSFPERRIAPLADLLLPDYGRLECCVFLPDQITYSIPSTIGERIGYIGVRLGESLQEAYLCGFLPASALSSETTRLRLSDFRDIDSLFDALESAGRAFAHLRDWLVGSFEAGWQQVSQLLNSDNLDLVYSFRSAAFRGNEGTVERAKLLDLGFQLGGQAFALVVAIHPEENQRYAISVQVLPVDMQYLPEGIDLAILDENDDALPPPVISRSMDNYIQRSFLARDGERFSVRISYQDTRLTELFEL